MGEDLRVVSFTSAVVSHEYSYFVDLQVYAEEGPSTPSTLRTPINIITHYCPDLLDLA